MYALPPANLRAWAEIDLAAIDHNFNLLQRLCDKRIMAVVKAGAYGHGLECVARIMDRRAVSFLGVANAGEARRLKQAGCRSRIYILGPSLREEREEIVCNGWTPCISSVEEARDFARYCHKWQTPPLKVHIALDSGMGRGGFLVEQLPRQLDDLLSLDAIRLEGIGSHMPCADEDREFSLAQIGTFSNLVTKLQQSTDFKYLHLANSAAIIGYDPMACCNLVRPGLMLYGINPMPQYQLDLRPVMTLKSRVILVRELPAGHGVSYGRSCVLAKKTRIATLGIGYADGYPRQVSGHGAAVWLHGRRCAVLGRVTMDQLMVDVSDLEQVQEGDEVELFGKNINVSEVAHLAGTISWEVLSGIGARVARITV